MQAAHLHCTVLQVKDELTTVENADMNGQPPEDSFARVGYHKDAEYAVNEQVKCVQQQQHLYPAVAMHVTNQLC